MNELETTASDLVSGAISSTRDSAEVSDRALGPLVLSFDLEEHHRIEAARGLEVSAAVCETYRNRMSGTTGWILDRLEERGIRATFFVVGQIARTDPRLVRRIRDSGHEVASHGWDHRRILELTPGQFRDDVKTSKDALEQASGMPVVGYRAPTFSLVGKTLWAVDILAEFGMRYDSSIYPVRHDRYGIPHAPREPFLVVGPTRELLEIPPATLRLGSWNVPIGGGGYFRLLPWWLMRRALKLAGRDQATPNPVLYFHPWEFDPGQPRLPLQRLNRFRTYTGIRSSRQRFEKLLGSFPFCRMMDLVPRLEERRASLPRFPLPSGRGVASRSVA